MQTGALLHYDGGERLGGCSTTANLAGCLAGTGADFTAVRTLHPAAARAYHRLLAGTLREYYLAPAGAMAAQIHLR